MFVRGWRSHPPQKYGGGGGGLQAFHGNVGGGGGGFGTQSSTPVHPLVFSKPTSNPLCRRIAAQKNPEVIMVQLFSWWYTYICTPPHFARSLRNLPSWNDVLVEPDITFFAQLSPPTSSCSSHLLLATILSKGLQEPI